ncbi:MAG: hypothetical protein KF833_12805 [Verrucomicrobiae bacterium]|nr:hypothetical protein [Verrucomicrobiae bacterium]
MNLEQLRALLWLRWRLTRNQWSRGGTIQAVLTAIGMGLGMCMGAAAAVGGLVVGYGPLSRAEPVTMQWVWDGVVAGFLLLWLIGLVTELQRSETIDMTRLMHLPATLRDVFLLNYVASHLQFSLAWAVPGALGLAAGLVLGRGWGMLPLLALVFGFFFMVTAWTYCLRGWLAALMVNPRKRRAAIMMVTVGAVLVFQVPNLGSQWWMRGHRERMAGLSGEQRVEALREQRAAAAVMVERVHRAVPFLWLPAGARSLAEGRMGMPWWAAAGMTGLGALGLWRAYGATLRFYRGEERGRRGRGQGKAGQPGATSGRPAGPVWVERGVPGMSGETAAMAWACLRSMLRAPEVKMALAINVVVFVVVGGGLAMNAKGALPEPVRALMPAGAVALTFFGMMQVMFNQFGFDRDGFRALVLLPARRSGVLLGKNLAVAPVALTVLGVLLGLLTGLGGMAWTGWLEAMGLFVAAWALLSLAGNVASILVPYRFQPGSTKPTKMTALTTFLILLVTSMFPVVIAPLMLPAAAGMVLERGWGWPGWVVSLGGATALAAASVTGYRFALEPMGQWLARRERAILKAVTEQVE